jgi:hypothetical protein
MSCSIVDAITGQDLVNFRNDCRANGMTNSQIVREAGYVSRRNDGTERVHYTSFYQELLYAQGKLAKVRVTVTDTFGGQPNYSWTIRHQVYIYKSNPVREVKKEIGYTGVKCDKIDMGSCIHLYPRGQAIVIIIQYV